MAKGEAIKLALGRLGSILLVAGGWLFAGFRLVLDLIGYSTIPEDVAVARTRLDQFLGLVLSIPWWAVWGFVLISTMWLIWVSWPRSFASSSTSAGERQRNPLRRYVSPFEGKAVAPPEPTPQRLINVIDSQDKHISSLIYAVRTWIRKHFEAANPYIDIHIELGNNSVFEVTYEGFQGRFFYRDDPLKDRPEIISHDAKIGANSHSSYTMRQFISSEFRDLLVSHRGQRQELALSENFCIKFSYFNRGGQKKEAYWPLMRNPFDISEPAD